MWMLGPVGFTTPWILLGLLALPALYWLLRAVPPAPVRRRFPAVALLLGLSDKQVQSARTPWWLLLLRLAALAVLILGFAGPVLNPVARQGQGGDLLILLDGSWGGARDWSRRIERVSAALDEAERDGRPVAVAQLSDPPAGGLEFQTAGDWRSRLPSLRPHPWQPAGAAWAEGLTGRFDTLWIADGLEWSGRAEVLAALETHGSVAVFQTRQPILALAPPHYREGSLVLSLHRRGDLGAQEWEVQAIGPDPTGVERDLARGRAIFAAGEDRAEVRFDLPPEIRNRLTRFALSDSRGAGVVALVDDSLRRRKVVLLGNGSEREGLQLLAPTHYLREALAPIADLIEVPLTEALLASPDVVILADVATLGFDEQQELRAWVEAGGLLVRFAGPRLAASELSPEDQELLPVPLRLGGRSVGGTMSWGEPRTLAPFDYGSPFFGLNIPSDIAVEAQVLAQPSPDLADRTLAALADGTPLVTRKALGQGQVVLFHVTANAEWSNLPMSELFLQMLERLAVSATGTRAVAAEWAGTRWQVDRVMDGFGRLGEGGHLAAVTGEDLAAALAQGAQGAALPPGLYRLEARRVAVNILGTEAILPALADWPAHIRPQEPQARAERPLIGPLLAVGLGLLLLDVLASLSLAGRLRRHGRILGLVICGCFPLPPDARADEAAIIATREVVLAYVQTGDAELDALSRAGLYGLGLQLRNRTTIEPGDPVAVDLEADDISFFPFLYWPVTEDQALPSPAAYRRLNSYLRTGGMVLFDTRDADMADVGATSAAARRLQLIAQPLDIPPLELIPEDHVLTRTFYLLQDFPGRHQGRSLWVEAAPPEATTEEGMPFRRLNDGVTPVVMGGNDWAAAWATDARGQALLPVGRGFAGERQREIAWRFGINLIMHVLTGNYKSDQVHVPALLERLGQ